jgi:methionine-rich copper-binding protein CopC
MLIVAPGRAAAHAELMRADPAIDSVVANAPTQVQLWFSEQPELRFSEVRVVDQAGRPVDRGDLRADPADPLSVIVGLNSLSPGSYTVSWKALSAVDGHVTRGVFVFTVGLDQTPTGPVISGQESGTTATPDRVAVRLLNYGGLALLLGFFPFVLWVLLPGLRIGAATADTAALIYRRVWKLGAIGAACALLGALGSLISQTATAVGVSFVQAIGPDLLSVAFGTRFALLWWSRVILLLCLVGVLLLARRAPGSTVLGRIALVLGLAEVLAWSLGSHAAAIPDISPAAVGTDWGHIVAMVVWTGGL